MSQLDTQILHQHYVLSCPDGREAQLLEAVERVDQQFQQMLDTTKLRSRERVGVLLAVNLAFENLELRQQLQALQQQLAQLQGTTDTAQADAQAERLQNLEAQLHQEHAAARQLTRRLDEALALHEKPTAPTSAEAALQDLAAPLEANEVAERLVTHLDNASEVDLPFAVPENQ